jgi:hypothetical protein
MTLLNSSVLQQVHSWLLLTASLASLSTCLVVVSTLLCKQIVLRPVLAVDLFGYLRDNSDVPAESQMLTCEAGTEDTHTIADAYGKPTEGTMSVLTLDCGSVSLRVGGINF